MGGPGGPHEAGALESGAIKEELAHAGQVGVNFFKLFLHISNADFMKRPIQVPEWQRLEHPETAEQEKRNQGRL